LLAKPLLAGPVPEGVNGMVAAAVAGMVLGFLAGLWAFRLRSRWCPRRGEWTFARPESEEDERLAREVVEANDPARNTPVDPGRLPAAELRRWVDQK
jgi:hypothetical protein